MRVFRLAFVFVSILLLPVGKSLALEDPSLRTRLLRDYPAALEGLESYYSHLRGEADEEEANVYVDKPVSKDHPPPQNVLGVGGSPLPMTRIRASRLLFALNGDRFFLKTMRVFSTKHVRNADGTDSITEVERPPDAPDRVFCKNPLGSFYLRYGENGGTPVVESVDDPTVINSQLQRVILPALYASFALEGHRISQLLKDPRFVIGAVHERQEGANKLLEFDFTYKPKDRNDFIYQQGRVVVSPDENWILKRYQTTSKKYQIAFQVDVEYEPPKNEGEIRLIRQVRRSNPFNSVTTSFSHLVHEQVPDAQFTLSAFGLPDINKPIAEQVPGQASRWYYWAAGVALLVAVGLKVYLGYVSKRQAKPA